MSALPERREPTHLLSVEIPLNLDARAAEAHDIQGALSEALKVIMAITQLGTLGLLCDEVNVSMREVGI